jgi:hypothetical protein
MLAEEEMSMIAGAEGTSIDAPSAAQWHGP